MFEKIKPGDLVVLSERSRHYPGHERGYAGYLNLDSSNEDAIQLQGVVVSHKDVVLYIGQYSAYCIVLKGEQKVFVYDLLPELKKYNG